MFSIKQAAFIINVTEEEIVSYLNDGSLASLNFEDIISLINADLIKKENQNDKKARLENLFDNS